MLDNPRPNLAANQGNESIVVDNRHKKFTLPYTYQVVVSQPQENSF
jgi:hypothetical protein